MSESSCRCDARTAAGHGRAASGAVVPVGGDLMHNSTAHRWGRDAPRARRGGGARAARVEEWGAMLPIAW